MPTPTLNDVHIDGILSQFSVAYRNPAYIWQEIFPRVPVEKKSDYYWVFPKDAWFRDDVAVRAPGTQAARSDYTVTTASYVCITRALAKAVPDEVRRNADNPLNPDLEATEFVMDQLMRATERRVAAKINTAASIWVYSASLAAGDQWSDDASEPFDHIEAAIAGIVNSIGRFPNVGVMSYDVWRHLKNHPDLLGRVQYTRPSGMVELEDLQRWFNLDRLLVGTALVNTSQDGVAPSMSQIWGDGLWLGYVPSRPSLLTPAAGYVLEWQTSMIKRFREDQAYTDVIEASHSTAEVISASDAGAYIDDAV